MGDTAKLIERLRKPAFTVDELRQATGIWAEAADALTASESTVAAMRAELIASEAHNAFLQSELETANTATGFYAQRGNDLDALLTSSEASLREEIARLTRLVEHHSDLREQYLAEATAAASEVERLTKALEPTEAGTIAENILLTVKELIKAESEHARKSGGQTDATNTSRDDADHWHAALIGFTVADCHAALNLVRRRARALDRRGRGMVEIPEDIQRQAVHICYEYEPSEHAICVAIMRERERCARFADEYVKRRLRAVSLIGDAIRSGASS